MTTCIVVMNRIAAALAADSTVSIPYRFGTKHFQGVSKVMSVHAKDPVGMMVYGSPDFAGLPWEIVAAEFRAQYPDSQALVQDHAHLFFQFLEKLLGAWVEREVQEELADSLFTPLLDSIGREWNQRAASVPARNVPVTLDKIVQDAVKHWTGVTRRPSTKIPLDPVDLTPRVTAALADLGRWTSNLSSAAKKMIVDAANRSTERLSIHEQYFSGVVFAGFGAEQRLPAVSCHVLGVPYSGQLRKKDAQVQQVSARHPAKIITFAEDRATRTFMEGIDPSIRKWFDGMVKQQGEELKLGEVYSEQLKAEMDLQINQRAESIVTAVSYLPKAGLAEFAESLVRITALSLRMSMAPETVGEPIDVAVLSRSDGLVWVKRTPYFSRDLQPLLPPFP